MKGNEFGKILLAALLSLSCPAFSAGTGGKGGIGGTGHAGGIGGTGIVGVITDFGSIFVNGLEVEYGPDTPVEIDARPGSEKDLSLGEVVTVIAERRNGKLFASRISVVDPVVGQVSSVGPDHRLHVLGQIVIATGRTVISGKAFAGGYVRVSGFRMSDGAILASRIESIPPTGTATVSGQVESAQGNFFRIGGLRIRSASPVKPGSEVIVSGRPDGEKMEATSISPSPSAAFPAQVENLDIQGFVRRNEEGNYLVDGMLLKGSGLRQDEFVHVSGKLSDGLHIDAEKFEPHPDHPVTPFPFEMEPLPFRGELLERPGLDAPEKGVDMDRPEFPLHPEIPQQMLVHPQHLERDD